MDIAVTTSLDRDGIEQETIFQSHQSQTMWFSKLVTVILKMA